MEIKSTTAVAGEEYFTVAGEIASITSICTKTNRIYGQTEGYQQQDWDFDGFFFSKNQPSPLDLVLPKRSIANSLAKNLVKVSNIATGGFYNQQKPTSELIEVDLTI